MMAEEGFSGDLNDTAEPGYRSLTPLAVVAVVLGLISPLYLLGGVLLVAPLLAIAASLGALSRLAANPEVLTGRGLALAGLALGVASLALGLSKGYTEKSLLVEQSLPVSQAWLDYALEGDAEQAYLLSLEASERSEAALQGEDGAETEGFSEFKSNSVASRLSGFETQSMPSLKEASGPLRAKWGRVQLLHTFRVDASDGDWEVIILLERSGGYDKDSGRWRVVNATLERAA